MEKEIIIDGYNFIHKIPRYKNLIRKGLEYTRHVLIEDLKSYFDHADFEIALVFDGSKKVKPHKEEHTHGIKITFSNNTADAAIERMVYKAFDKSRILVVTDDNLTRSLIFGMGAFYISCENFYKLMDSSDKYFKEKLKRNSTSALKHKLKL